MTEQSPQPPAWETYQIPMEPALHRAAEVAGRVSGRSVADQLMHWARVGREVARSVAQQEVDDVLDGRRAYDEVSDAAQAVVRVHWSESLDALAAGVKVVPHLLQQGQTDGSEADSAGCVVRRPLTEGTLSATDLQGRGGGGDISDASVSRGRRRRTRKSAAGAQRTSLPMQCAWCRRLMDSNGEYSGDPLPELNPGYSSGICAPCREVQRRESEGGRSGLAAPRAIRKGTKKARLVPSDVATLLSDRPRLVPADVSRHAPSEPEPAPAAPADRYAELDRRFAGRHIPLEKYIYDR